MVELKENTGELMFRKMDWKLLEEMIYLMRHIEFEHWGLCHIQISFMHGVISMCNSLVFVPDLPRGSQMDAYHNAVGLLNLDNRLTEIEKRIPY